MQFILKILKKVLQLTPQKIHKFSTEKSNFIQATWHQTDTRTNKQRLEKNMSLGKHTKNPIDSANCGFIR